MGRRKKAVLIIVAASFMAFSTALVAKAQEEDTGPKPRGHAPIAWVGAVMTNVVYLPFKVLYAGTGGFVGGLAYVATVGDEKAFNAVWDVAGRGTYLVTPSMLEGKEAVRLLGP